MHQAGVCGCIYVNKSKEERGMVVKKMVVGEYGNTPSMAVALGIAGYIE